MALQMYRDDAMTQPILQAERFTTGTTLPLSSLTGADVQSVYKYTGTGYIKLTAPSGYSIVGNSVILTSALITNQHIVILPTNDLDITFTGTEGSTRVQTKKVVFNKTGAFIYDGLKLYSENFLVEPIEVIDTIYDTGFYTVATSGLMIYDKNGIELTDANSIGISGLSTDMSALTLWDCAVLINDIYIGDCLGNDAGTIVVPIGTVIPTPTYVTDKVEVLSTGDLTFALGTLGGPIPANEAFKRLLNIPTLIAAEPTQYIWLRESAVIPSVTTELPNMPFKLAGQEYPE
jgi:hypothetical protein